MKKKTKNKRKSYVLYKSQLDSFCDLIKKKTKREMTWKDAYGFGVERFDGFMQSTDGHLSINELEWQENKYPTIFVKDKKIVEMMYHANLEIIPESLVVPYGGVVSFAFPQGLIIDGIEIKGCLFAQLNAKEQREVTAKYFKEQVGEDKKVDFTSQDGSHNYEGNCIYVISMIDNKNYPTKVQHLRLWFRDIDAANAASEEWIFNNLRNDDWVLEQEYRQQTVMFRICYTLCVYMSAFSDVLSPGTPPRSVTTYKLPQGAKSYTLSLVDEEEDESIGTSPSTHFRRWHFRSLKHEKYKRNPDGSVRIVFVKSSIVNAHKESEFSIA